MTRTRRQFTAEQNATADRRHLAGKEAVSDLADELGVQPSQIHVWVKQVLDDNSAVLNKLRDSSNNATYIVADAIKDAAGQLTQVIDGRNLPSSVTESPG